MKNKNLLFKFGLMTFCISCLGISFTLATSFKFTMPKIDGLNENLGQDKYVTKGITPIHFVENWNDFWWFIYFTNYEDVKGSNSEINENGEDDEDTGLATYYVSTNDDENYECKTHMEGYYYNAERWERLWPLDETNWNLRKIIENKNGGDGGLTTNGWIYTDCAKVGYNQEYCKCEWKVYSEATKQCIDDPDWETSSECDPDDTECEQKIEVAECKRELNRSGEYAIKKGFYGMVEHTYRGQTFGFVVWTDYNMGGWKWVTIKTIDDNVVKAPTFVIFNNISPMGFVYDYNGWLWFAWCQIEWSNWGTNATPQWKRSVLWKLYTKIMDEQWFDDDFEYTAKYGVSPMEESGLDGEVECKDIWTLANSLLKVLIEWLVRTKNDSDYKVENLLDSKSQIFASADVSNSTLVNYAKRKSEDLCGWKWRNLQQSDDGSRTVCLDLAGSDFDASDFKGRTLIAKDGNVVVYPFSDADDESYYDIFVNNWNLIIGWDEQASRFVFTTQWFIARNNDETPLAINDFITEVETKSQGFPYSGDLSWVGSFIRWNFIVDGRVLPSNGDNKLKNKYFIYWKFTTKDSVEDLENLFIWRCSNWSVTDKFGWQFQSEDQWKYCPNSILSRSVGIDIRDVEDPNYYAWKNPYDNASLIIIDQNYFSPMYW